MARTLRIRAAIGIDKDKTPEVITLGFKIYNGMNNDKVTYVSPSPALPAFLVLIQNTVTAQQDVSNRTKGAAATRDIQRGLLLTGVESQRMYVQTLVDASPASAVALIENVGLVVAGVPLHAKAALTVTPGKQSGSVLCDANVGLLIGVGVLHPAQNKFFNWSYTVDGGKTFLSWPPTSKGKTTITGLTPLTLVGVRVNLNNGDGPGDWSQVVSVLVR